MSLKSVLAFAATNSTTSINKRLVLHAAQVLQDELGAEVEIETLDLNDFDMPVYSPEREKMGIPEAAEEFFARLGAADGLLISFAEYNGNYTAAFKNIFDWSSRIKMAIYQDKPVLMMATSPGKGGGQNVLRVATEAAPFFGGNLTGSFKFGPFAEHFDTDTERLKTTKLALELREALVAFNVAVQAASD
ncbi:MAG: NAD(P)H-dependent oxidoreductase [Pseudomonadota bacterium]